jgi:hypothetical protein
MGTFIFFLEIIGKGKGRSTVGMVLAVLCLFRKDPILSAYIQERSTTIPTPISLEADGMSRNGIFRI